jgi:hypothetical protein
VYEAGASAAHGGVGGGDAEDVVLEAVPAPHRLRAGVEPRVEHPVLLVLASRRRVRAGVARVRRFAAGGAVDVVHHVGDDREPVELVVGEPEGPAHDFAPRRHGAAWIWAGACV